MAYVDYNYYENSYLLGRTAVISSADFPFVSELASQKIDLKTFNRITELTEVPEAVKKCACELAECIQTYTEECKAIKDEISKNGFKTSEKVGEYSINYSSRESMQKVLTELEQAQKEKEYSIIVRWLMPTGLLYMGCY